MESDVSVTSFSKIDLNAKKSQYSKYIDEICPYYMMWGMSWEDFWYGDIAMLGAYWRAHQLDIERRNQELWMQGIYIRDAIVSAFEGKRGQQFKYPEKPYRLTELTELEKEAEKKRMVEQMREQLMSHKQSWDAKHKGVVS